MCGSDTLTTVVSSTSMNVANITETAMSHGLIVPMFGHGIGGAVRSRHV